MSDRINPMAILAMLGLGQRQPADPAEGIESAILSFKGFDPISPASGVAFKKVVQDLSEIDPSEIDTVFITVLRKDRVEPGKPCEDCGQIHEGNGMGITQMVFVLGDELTLHAAVGNALRESKRRSKPERTMNLDEIFADSEGRPSGK